MDSQRPRELKDYRCPACGRLLFKSDATVGQVEALCRRCKETKLTPLTAVTNKRLY